MSTREIVFITFLIVNTVGSLIYMFICLFSEKRYRVRGILQTVVFLLTPGVGPLIFMLGWVFYKYVFKTDVDLSDVVFSKDREHELVRANEEQERNVVPLEEAIEVTDNADLRNLVMNVAQGDFQESLAAISLALNCEDTETAHYAASVLQDALNEFRFTVTKQYAEVQKRDENLPELGRNLMIYMNKVLVQKVFSDVEQISFVEILKNVGEILFEACPEALTSDIYEMVCLRLLEINRYDDCKTWCKRGKTAFPNTLSSYTCELKLFFNSNQKEEFFASLQELKDSSVIIDKTTLELIRAFQ